jgi:large subunit ribosomal protein L6
VSVNIAGNRVEVKGPKGTLQRELPPEVSVAMEDNEVLVKRGGDDRRSRSMHGLSRTLVNNMVEGVSNGFSRSLEIIGVGYRVEQKKDFLVFALGYSHPIYYEVPKGIEAKLDGATKVTVSGIDRELVGATAAKIRSFRPPEPYKGKGVKYADETIRRKEGKSGGR